MMRLYKRARGGPRMSVHVCMWTLELGRKECSLSTVLLPLNWVSHWTELKAQQFWLGFVARGPPAPKGLPILQPHLSLQCWTTGVHSLTFYMIAGDSYSGPQTCRASALTHWAIFPAPRVLRFKSSSFYRDRSSILTRQERARVRLLSVDVVNQKELCLYKGSLSKTVLWLGWLEKKKGLFCCVTIVSVTLGLSYAKHLKHCSLKFSFWQVSLSCLDWPCTHSSTSSRPWT